MGSKGAAWGSSARDQVAAWVEAVRTEREPYVRSWLVVEGNGGLRPEDQQAALPIADLVFNAEGVPVAVSARWEGHGFKRHADIRQPLPQEVADTLKAWLDEHPNRNPNSYVWPWRDKAGHVHDGQPQTLRTITEMRKAFMKRHDIRVWITARAMRHFVRTVFVEAEMPPAERCYWQGHTPDLNNMDVQYGGRGVEETLELQRRILPHGPMAVFVRVETTSTKDAYPVELRDIWDRVYAGEMESNEAGEKIRELVRALRKQEASRIVTP